MFGWSMFFGIVAVLALFASGGFFIAHFTIQQGERPKGEQKQKPFQYYMYYIVLAVALGIAGLGLLGTSYYYFYWNFAGKVTTPNWLNPRMIYRVGGQAEIEGQNAVFLGNAKEDVWCVNSEPINPEARFARTVKSPEGKWRLEVLNLQKIAEK